jgi:hypothetical protein
VHFSHQKLVATITLDALQNYIIDYYHFLIKKEFSYPLFNGHIAHVHVSVGEGSFIASTEDFEHLYTEKGLTDNMIPDQTRHTVE